MSEHLSVVRIAREKTGQAFKSLVGSSRQSKLSKIQLEQKAEFKKLFERTFIAEEKERIKKNEIKQTRSFTDDSQISVAVFNKELRNEVARIVVAAKKNEPVKSPLVYKKLGIKIFDEPFFNQGTDIAATTSWSQFKNEILYPYFEHSNMIAAEFKDDIEVLRGIYDAFEHLKQKKGASGKVITYKDLKERLVKKKVFPEDDEIWTTVFTDLSQPVTLHGFLEKVQLNSVDIKEYEEHYNDWLNDAKGESGSMTPSLMFGKSAAAAAVHQNRRASIGNIGSTTSREANSKQPSSSQQQLKEIRIAIDPEKQAETEEEMKGIWNDLESCSWKSEHSVQLLQEAKKALGTLADQVTEKILGNLILDLETRFKGEIEKIQANVEALRSKCEALKKKNKDLSEEERRTLQAQEVQSQLLLEDQKNASLKLSTAYKAAARQVDYTPSFTTTTTITTASNNTNSSSSSSSKDQGPDGKIKQRQGDPNSPILFEKISLDVGVTLPESSLTTRHFESKQAMDPPRFLSFTHELMPVKQQGPNETGSCHALLSIKEWQLSVARREKAAPLSVDHFTQEITKLARKDQESEPLPAVVEHYLMVLRDVGVASKAAYEELYGKPTKKSLLELDAQRSTFSTYLRIRDLHHLKVALFKYGPLLAVLPVYQASNPTAFWTKMDDRKEDKEPALFHGAVLSAFNDESEKVQLVHSLGTGFGRFGVTEVPYKDLFSDPNVYIILCQGWAYRETDSQKREIVDIFHLSPANPAFRLDDTRARVIDKLEKKLKRTKAVPDQSLSLTQSTIASTKTPEKEKEEEEKQVDIVQEPPTRGRRPRQIQTRGPSVSRRSGSRPSAQPAPQPRSARTSTRRTRTPANARPRR